MIGTIVPDISEVGYYEQSQKIVKILLTIVTSLGTVMLPRIANTFASGEKEKVNKYMHKSFNLVFLLAFPIIFGIIAISDKFIPIFFGQGYEKVSILVKVISLIILLIGLSNVTGTQYLLPTKRQKEYTTSVICGAIINFTMNLMLIGRFGAIGASIGTVIAELTVTSMQIYFVRKDFDIKNILKMSRKYVISSLIMYAVCLIIGIFKVNNLISVILQVLCGILTYGIVLIILKDEFVYEILDKLKEKNVIKTIREKKENV